MTSHLITEGGKTGQFYGLPLLHWEGAGKDWKPVILSPAQLVVGVTLTFPEFWLDWPWVAKIKDVSPQEVSGMLGHGFAIAQLEEWLGFYGARFYKPGSYAERV